MSLYYVENCQRCKSATGKSYLSFTLNDGEQKINANWFNPINEPEVYNHKIISAIVVQKGNYWNLDSVISVSDYDDLPQNSKLRSIKVRSDIKPEHLISLIDKMLSNLNIDSCLKNFMNYSNYKEIINNYYKDVMGGLKVHHSLLGGLIQHVYEVLQAYDALTNCQQVSKLNHGIVIIAAFFHDFGKVREYSIKEWKETPKLPLLGHIYMSAHAVQNMIDQYNRKIAAALKDETIAKVLNNAGVEVSLEMYISEKVRDVIVHCILAHHGKLEYGSPVAPACPEAYVLNICDLLSARLNQFENASDMERCFYLENVFVVKDY